MKSGMKNGMKKIGWLAVSLLPGLAMLVIQVACFFVGIVFFTILNMAKETGYGSVDLTEIILRQSREYLIPILMISQLVSILVFGIWYYFAYGRKKRPETAARPDACRFLLIVAMGILAQFFSSGVLSLVEIYMPQVMEDYNELMEKSGIMEVTPLVLFSTVILAPLCEELVCRGLTMRLAERVSARFWVVNFIQAFVFGLLHLNLVQGTYALAFGLLAGLLYRRFRNIWLCMLLHAAMNFASILVAPAYSVFPENALPVVCIVTALAAATACFFCYRGIMAEPRSGGVKSGQ